MTLFACITPWERGLPARLYDIYLGVHLRTWPKYVTGIDLEEFEMSKKRFVSVWDAIENTPREAASTKVRSELMIKLQETLRRQQLTQLQAAKLLGVTQPRVSDLMHGKIELFSMEMLIDMLTQVGMQVKVTTRKAANS